VPFPSCSEEFPIRVVVVFADALTAHLLVADLQRHRQFHAIECAPEISSVLDCIAENSPDLLLVSANLPEAGLPLLKQIRSKYPRTRAIVILEGCQQRQLVVELFRAGAKGVFDRSNYDIRALCRCLRCVAAGQVWASSQQTGFVLEAFAETASLHIVTADGDRLLTRREEDVVRLVAEGLGNREVAQQLRLSGHTVKNYLFNVFDKLGISSRSELVMYALSHSDNKSSISAASDDSPEEPSPTGTGCNAIRPSSKINP
jgi:DNA-binding NarL/FixJ family response regulator